MFVIFTEDQMKRRYCFSEVIVIFLILNKITFVASGQSNTIKCYILIVIYVSGAQSSKIY